MDWKGELHCRRRTHLDDFGELHGLFGSVLQVIDGEDLEARVVDDLVGGLHVGALQAGNDGDAQVHALDGADEAAGNVVASHDAAKDVDKDGRDLGVARNQGEGFLDGLWRGTTSDVEKVGGFATVELDNVHGCHG